ncbi:hypothetical protein VNO77_28632 [Canavalia gladiata]|uniref:Uncharacterized protein n=1 Tax=Canavalia gladiata TaxID=3824 RepID=A0AAN9L0I8_CANGL
MLSHTLLHHFYSRSYHIILTYKWGTSSGGNPPNEASISGDKASCKGPHRLPATVILTASLWSWPTPRFYIMPSLFLHSLTHHFLGYKSGKKCINLLQTKHTLLMEHSLNSSMAKPVSEESGWTSYFEDFSKGMEQQSHCSSLGGSSLISDAASSAAWKLSHHNHFVSCSSVKVRDPSNLSKKLCFRKTRTKQISEDDPLEDTASSPVNSPKVGDLNRTGMISRKIDDQLDGSSSKGKGFKSENYPKLQTDECEVNFNGNNIECTTNLKKRGLCLVPLSMLLDYSGYLSVYIASPVTDNLNYTNHC